MNLVARFIIVGLRCKAAKDCISYSYYGEDACSDVCGAKDACSLQDKGGNPDRNSVCCKAIPLDGQCDPLMGENSGCLSGLFCAKMADEEKYRCAEKEKKLWVIGVALAILAASGVTLGYNIQRYAFRKDKFFPVIGILN